MVENLSEKKTTELLAAFEIFDKDRDGALSTKELGTVLRNLGKYPNEDELDELVKEIDLDGSGKIEFDEFLYLMVKIMNQTDSEEEELKEAFNFLDIDGAGYITSHQLRYLMLKEGLTNQEVDEMIKEIDEDNDGRIDFDEFKKIMMSK